MDAKARAATAFRKQFGEEPGAIARAPGRVNLLGEHVDYNDGFVLPAAIDRATYVAFSAAPGDHIGIVAADYDEQAEFSTQGLDQKRGLDRKPLAQWARYPAGVAWALSGGGLRVSGMEAAIASEVPRGAGLSSSASVELAFATAWQALGGWAAAPMAVAVLCRRAENEYVGVNSGIMDQAASACGEKDRLLFLDCRTLEYQLLPLPAAAVIIIADTGVRHTLTASGYNDRRAACEEAVRLLKEKLPEITALRDVPVAEFNALAGMLPREIEMRARHVVEEIQRAQSSVALLQAGDVEAFGELMDASHASLRDLYEVSCPELNAMVDIAQLLPGCYGARLTGAGFGGCTVNLVERGQAEKFMADLSHGYSQAMGREPEIYVCRAADGASLV